jgi:hypothetical protein
MQLPLKHISFVDEIVSKCLKYSEKKSVLAPTLICGNSYEGSHYIIREIHRKLQEHSGDKVHSFFFPIALTESNITAELQKTFTHLNLTKKKPTIFFLEGIDRLFNLSVKTIKRDLFTGKGANSVGSHRWAHDLSSNVFEFYIFIKQAAIYFWKSD